MQAASNILKFPHSQPPGPFSLGHAAAEQALQEPGHSILIAEADVAALRALAKDEEQAALQALKAGAQV
jgi:hypothetical protein